MLDQSKEDLSKASEEERRAAEIIAFRYLAAELEQDLMPADEANRIVAEHKEQKNETWLRAVYATLMGLRSAKTSGYRIESADRPAQSAAEP